MEPDSDFWNIVRASLNDVRLVMDAIEEDFVANWNMPDAYFD